MMDIVLKFLLISLLSLVSCDFIGTYNFVVENKLSEPIFLHIKTDEYDSLRNRMIKLEANDTLLILTTGTENLGMKEQPKGVFNDTLSVFDSLTFLLDTNKRTNLNLKLAKYWTYRITGDQEGTYKLVIDSTIIN